MATTTATETSRAAGTMTATGTAPASTSTMAQEPVTAQNVFHIFGNDVSSAIHPVPSAAAANSVTVSTGSSSAEQDGELAGYDAEQIRLMDEVCIVLDPNDDPIGSASKKTCHLMSNISKGLLHRAFSAFVFDSQHRLLLQQRASEKITFPDMWTNTCCSHPLAHPSETGGETLLSRTQGAARAAQRKLGHELGIPASDVPAEDFHFLTRIHYIAPSVDTIPTGSAAASGEAQKGKWGEHEIDYILLTQPPRGTVSLDINANEVRDTKWVTREELKTMLEQHGKGVFFTPWFRLICRDGLLWDWWARLEKEGNFASVKADERIWRLGDVNALVDGKTA